ncbi:MAG TPA: helix-turn-helix transcriptional regulator [Moheibacter sp.]|nr:helix-turn-helix transcriptional regulator [Moheibacter sp.]
MSVGKNLRRLRSQTKFSQNDIAEQLGIDRKTYANWESEANDVKSEFIPKLATIFDVEISELFRQASTEIVINQQNSDNKDTSINGIILLLSDKEAVEQLIEVLKKKLK